MNQVICGNCGAIVDDNSKFCNNCGALTAPPEAFNQPNLGQQSQVEIVDAPVFTPAPEQAAVQETEISSSGFSYDAAQQQAFTPQQQPAYTPQQSYSPQPKPAPQSFYSEPAKPQPYAPSQPKPSYNQQQLKPQQPQMNQYQQQSNQYRQQNQYPQQLAPQSNYGGRFPYGEPKYQPLGALGFFGAGLLMMIPGIGLIVAIIWAIGGCKKVNKRNFARGMLLLWLTGIVIGGILYLVLLFVFKLNLFDIVMNIVKSKYNAVDINLFNNSGDHINFNFTK